MTSTVISLEIRFFDSEAPEDRGQEVGIPIPCLHFYLSAAQATEQVEEINIVEGDIWFFAADGAPLEASFSQMPVVTADKGIYFPGIYNLVSGDGDSLQQFLADDELAEREIIAYLPGTEAYAQACGWTGPKAANKAIAAVLESLPPKMAERFRFRMWPPPGGPSDDC